MSGVPKALVQGDGDEGSTVEWQTPEALFDALDKEFGPFTMDPATALGYHTSDVILARGGTVVTLDGPYKVSSIAPPGLARLLRPGENAYRTGLEYEWTGRVYLNHPYGRSDWRWMKKARDSVREGDAEIVVALVPVKTGMPWWRKYVVQNTRIISHDLYTGPGNVSVSEGWLETEKPYGADIVRFLPGRQRFGGAPSSAPFNSAVIVWRK